MLYNIINMEYTHGQTYDWNGDKISYIISPKILEIEFDGMKLYIPKHTRLYKSEPKFISFWNNIR